MKVDSLSCDLFAFYSLPCYFVPHVFMFVSVSVKDGSQMLIKMVKPDKV